MADNFVIIENWLPPTLANEIASRIEDVEDWSVRLCDKTKGPRVLSPAEFGEIGLTPEEFAKCPSRDVSDLARTGQMAYLFFIKSLVEFDKDLYDQLCCRFLEAANGMADIANDVVVEPVVSMYTAGCFLGQHTDTVGKREVAFIANFSRNWQPDFGGCLTVFKQGRWEVIPPKFNSLILMDVKTLSSHYVSQVASWVTAKRTAITGWTGRS